MNIKISTVNTITKMVNAKDNKGNTYTIINVKNISKYTVGQYWYINTNNIKNFTIESTNVIQKLKIVNNKLVLDTTSIKGEENNYYIKMYGMTENEVLNAIKGLQGKDRSEELRLMALANSIN